ncbi:hypothetical protein HRbin28_01463 [bacterium HR28]|nr:hypothetical protein HRbin28_01463 [bacterium HR28]
MSLNQQTPRPDLMEESARQALRAVELRRYAYPEGFCGFTARFFARDGTLRVQGSVRVSDPATIELVSEKPSPLMGWVREILSSEVAHRMPRSATDRGHLRLIQLDDPLGDMLEFLDDPMRSRYRVAEGVITVVDRVVGAEGFTIVVLDHWELPDGRILPRHYAVGFREAASGNLQRLELHTAEYTTVNDVWLLTRHRTITLHPGGQIDARELELTGHQLVTR